MKDINKMLEPTNAPTVLVSIGMPIYNGAAKLAAVIDSVLKQSLQNFEIIISDNGSTDQTAEICQDFASRDARIQYFRQPATLNPTENFRFVLRQAKGPYFMWAAHDDTRDPDFVEKMVEALEANPKAVLAFGDLVRYIDGEPSPLELHFSNVGLSKLRRLNWAAVSQLHHLYGVWRIEALRRIEWRHADWWHDTPLMMAATLLGDFIHVPGTVFHYQYNRRPFFNWQGRFTGRNLIRELGKMVKNIGDLFHLVWLSAVTVGRLAGPATGALAGMLVFGKVSRQVFWFLYRRIWRSKRNAIPR